MIPTLHHLNAFGHEPQACHREHQGEAFQTGSFVPDLSNLTRAEGGEPQLLIHPDGTQAAGLNDGTYAALESEVGRVQRRVRVTGATQPGVVVVEGTWWGLSAPDGQSINTLTAQTLTDRGGGSTAPSVTRVAAVS